MSYLIAKKFDETGCIAVKVEHGSPLAEFTRQLEHEVGDNGIRIITISRPSAYGEYEPYTIIDTMEIFKEKVLSML